MVRAIQAPLAVIGARGPKVSKNGSAYVVMPGLMGAREAAEALGCSVANLGRQANLPVPVAELACGKVWLADEIRALAKERGRR
jgi:predicted ATP-dependent serine protease